MDVVRETPTTTVVDGNWGFGYTVSEHVMRTTVEKARENNVAAATVFRQGHVGRVADYPLMVAEAGMIGMMTADSGRAAKAVVPFGGREPRLGTNPICIGNYPLIARVTRFTSTLETVYDKNMSGSKKKNPLRPSYEEGELRDKSIEKKQQAGFQPKDLLRIIRKATEKAPGGA